ncbi:MAG: LysE family transporter [Clostridiales bacterium]|nr:LysE family transporter [Clostridiales bacterium]
MQFDRTLFFAFLPQYVKDSGKSYQYQCWILGLLFMLITYLVFMAYGIFAAAIKAKFLNSPKRLVLIQKLFGYLFLVFAAQLAIS